MFPTSFPHVHRLNMALQFLVKLNLGMLGPLRLINIEELIISYCVYIFMVCVHHTRNQIYSVLIFNERYFKFNRVYQHSAYINERTYSVPLTIRNHRGYRDPSYDLLQCFQLNSGRTIQRNDFHRNEI